LSSQGGTLIRTRKGGGLGTKGIIGLSSKIRGVSWFTQVREVETLGGWIHRAKRYEPNT